MHHIRMSPRPLHVKEKYKFLPLLPLAFKKYFSAFNTLLSRQESRSLSLTYSIPLWYQLERIGNLTPTLSVSFFDEGCNNNAIMILYEINLVFATSSISSVDKIGCFSPPPPQCSYHCGSHDLPPISLPCLDPLTVFSSFLIVPCIRS